MYRHLSYNDDVLEKLVDKGRSKTETLKNKISFARRDHLISAREDIMIDIIDRAMELKYTSSDIFKIRLYVYDKFV